ncbi:MAG: 2OG-Fe(II) oxygenase [Saprospirales bacterium]|nr:2OG-Fe(II) oxygenase [Saprospirales bacterium]MBK8492245.1 2OG-Fe(II) oxygenase [Saprospirales bacterium]
MEPHFEHLIQSVLEEDYGTIEHFLEPDLVAQLRNNLLGYFEQGIMKPAGVGKRFTYQQNAKVRGDLIHWIEDNPQDPVEKAFLQHVSAFVNYLNATCYTGINAFEFHYAFYDEGSFYRRHLDQFDRDRGRKFSFVVYLNEHWTKKDGGELALYLPDRDVVIEPKGGSAVFFKADIVEHEVLPTFRPRMSIAGWLKRI